MRSLFTETCQNVILHIGSCMTCFYDSLFGWITQTRINVLISGDRFSVNQFSDLLTCMQHPCEHKILSDHLSLLSRCMLHVFVLHMNPFECECVLYPPSSSLYSQFTDKSSHSFSEVQSCISNLGQKVEAGGTPEVSLHQSVPHHRKCQKTEEH